MWQRDFCVLFKLIKIYLICSAWEQHKLAQVVYSMTI